MADIEQNGKGMVPQCRGQGALEHAGPSRDGHIVKQYFAHKGKKPKGEQLRQQPLAVRTTWQRPVVSYRHKACSPFGTVLPIH
jgi:hypothetical protein